MRYDWTEQEVQGSIQDLCFLSKLASGAGLDLVNSRVVAFTQGIKTQVNELTPDEVHCFVEYLKGRYKKYREEKESNP